MTRTLGTILAATLLLLTLVACSGAASSPPPSASPTPAPAAIDSVEGAAARVIELNPGFAGIGPRDPNLLGGCCAWDGTATGDGFTVTFEVGWGDCPSGCIDRHRWTYAVGTDGTVTLVEESGSPVPSGVPGPGSGSSGSGGDGSNGGGGIPAGGTGIQGRAMAGPTCPVVSDNDPACDDRPLAGVTIIVLTQAGTEAARATTDANGAFAFSLPAGPFLAPLSKNEVSFCDEIGVSSPSYGIDCAMTQPFQPAVD
jgi:hypothetical protein